MAQDFVEATSALVGHRTINIMDTNAIIIASTEKNRIGTFHQGAAEVLATGKPVLVRKENLAAYPGAREGYNMPIYLEDEMIGVVGMFGDEAEVRDTANLLCVYVSQQFAQFQLAQKQKRNRRSARSCFARSYWAMRRNAKRYSSSVIFWMYISHFRIGSS